MQPTPALLRQAATRFAALADETRLRLLARLKEGEASVGELVDDLGIGQASASKHLAILRDAGFLKVRRQANRAIYSINDRTAIKMCDLVCDSVRRHHERLGAELAATDLA